MKQWILRLLFSLMLTGTFFIPAGAAGISYDMGDDANWNVRVDGAADQMDRRTAALGYYSMTVGDIIGDSSKDLIVGARRQDYNGREDSSSLYILNGDRFSTLTGLGNILDLTSSANYDIRIDGAHTNDEGSRSPVAADFNGDGKLDLAFASYLSDNNGTDSGSVYVLYHTLLEGYTGTGNTIDLADAANYNLRYDGRTGTSIISVHADDLNENGKADLMIQEFIAGIDGKRGVYIVYDNLMDDYPGTGNDINLSIGTNFNLKYNTPSGIDMTNDDIYTADMDNDGALDLVLCASQADPNGDVFPFEGSLYIISNDILMSHGGTGNAIDLSDPAEYSIRYDGDPARYVLGAARSVALGDVDNNGKADIVIGQMDVDINSPELDSIGSVYVIYDSLIDDHIGTGNVVSLSNTANYNLRFDAAEPNELHVYGAIKRIADMNNNGKNDLILGDSGGQESWVDVSAPGKVYLIFDKLLEGYTGTGNVIDLGDPENYNIKYDGAAAEDWLAGSTMEMEDLNGDGLKDAVMGAWGTDFHGPQTGSVYIVYYFPHQITLDDIFLNTSGNTFKVTGNVSAPNNATNIAAVQWGHERSFGDDSGDFEATWIDCVAIDGAFDSNDEDFRCSHAALNDGSGDPHFASPHSIFLRAKDEKGIYTPIAQYVTATYTVNSPISGIAAISGDGRGTITWTTSEPGSTQIEYGPTGAYGSTTPEIDTAPRVTAHSYTISGLEDCKLYHYRVRSKDVATNEAVSTDQTFTTLCGSSGGGGGGGGGTRSISRNPVSPLDPDSSQTPDSGSPETSESSAPGNTTGTDQEWFAPYLKALQIKGIMTIATIDAPEEITRGEVIKAIIIALKAELPTPTTAPFTDVPADHSLAPYLLAAKELGIVNGYPDGSFKPDTQINRAETLKILLTAKAPLILLDPEAVLPFSDVLQSDWFWQYVALAFNEKLVQGYADGTFRPANPISFAEFAKLLTVWFKL